jgi:hypothetical protein
MGLVRCEVHQILEGDPLRVVRIRATAFQDKKDKSEKCIRFIVRIRSTRGKSGFFEAEYADDDYIVKWKKNTGRNPRGNDLVFMSKPCRELLKDERGNLGAGDLVDLEEIQSKDLLSLYAIHTALSDDSNEGQIWIRPLQNKEEIENKRRIVRIKRKDAKPVVYSEVLFADDHYLEHWKEKGINFGNSGPDYNVIFISAWYRRLLGIGNTPVILDNLDVKPLRPLNLPAFLYHYPRNHPQALVLGASMMGIIGFGLGVIGTGLGAIGINDWLAKNISPSLTNFSTPFGFVLCVLGLAIAFFGIMGLVRR